MAEPLSWQKHLHTEGCDSFFAKPYLQNLQRYDMHFDRVKQELDNEPWARRHPLMLLKGFLYAKMEKPKEAIKSFEDVLKEDPCSLNANLNLIFIYMKLGQKKLSKKYQVNIQEISKNESSFHQCILRARWQYAETMSMVELHKQKQPGAKLVKNYYKQVLDDSKDCNIPQNEMVDWQFGYAFLCMSSDGLHGKTDSEFYYEARQMFYEIASGKGNATEESGHFASEGNLGGNPEKYHELLHKRGEDVIPKSWCFLAALLSRHERKNEKLLGEKILPEHQNFTLEKCIEEAIKLDPKNTVVLRRAGQVYMTVGMMDKAKLYLDKALVLEQRKCDYTFNLLGRWFFMMYQKQEGGPEEMDYLDLSIENYEKAVEMGTTIWHTYRNLAEAYFIKQDYIGAIAKCRMSKERGGWYDSKLYKIWGDCLQAQGEDPEKKLHMAEKLKKGEIDRNWKFGAIYHNDDGEEVAQVVSRLEKTCHSRGWYFDRNVQPGEDIVKESSKQLEKCEYLLVFFSEKFFSEPESLPHLILNGFCMGKSKIVPVLLGDNKQVPTVLKSRKAVKYDESQAFVDGFKQLFYGKTTVNGIADLIERLNIDPDHASEFAEESASNASGATAGFPQQADDSDV